MLCSNGTVWCGLWHEENPISACNLTAVVSFIRKHCALNIASHLLPHREHFCSACVCVSVCVCAYMHVLNGAHRKDHTDHRIPTLQPTTLPFRQKNQYSHDLLWTIPVDPLLKLKNIIEAVPWSHYQFKGMCRINKRWVHGVKRDSGKLPSLCVLWLSHSSRILTSIQFFVHLQICNSLRILVQFLYNIFQQYV